MTKRFRDMAHVRTANINAGFHFFDQDTLRFFSSRVSDDLYGGRFFVTSERTPDGPRQYTVRMVDDNASVTTVGEFRQYPTHYAAHRAAAALAQEQDHE